VGDEQKIVWEKGVEENFRKLIDKVPAVMRGMAEGKVRKKMEGILAKDGRQTATEKDMVNAFFEATPFGFHGPMKTDMTAFGIDYTQYGHPK
jgi:hypothetical protein